MAVMPVLRNIGVMIPAFCDTLSVQSGTGVR
jgi:hypothetical protein